MAKGGLSPLLNKLLGLKAYFDCQCTKLPGEPFSVARRQFIYRPKGCPSGRTLSAGAAPTNLWPGPRPRAAQIAVCRCGCINIKAKVGTIFPLACVLGPSPLGDFWAPPKSVKRRPVGKRLGPKGPAVAWPQQQPFPIALPISCWAKLPTGVCAAAALAISAPICLPKCCSSRGPQALGGNTPPPLRSCFWPPKMCRFQGVVRKAIIRCFLGRRWFPKANHKSCSNTLAFWGVEAAKAL